MNRADLLKFDGISRTVLETRITVLVRILDALEAGLVPECRDLIANAVRVQLDREHGR
jgi:hypothetical protein